MFLAVAAVNYKLFKWLIGTCGCPTPSLPHPCPLAAHQVPPKFQDVAVFALCLSAFAAAVGSAFWCFLFKQPPAAAPGAQPNLIYYLKHLLLLLK